MMMMMVVKHGDRTWTRATLATRQRNHVYKERDNSHVHTITQVSITTLLMMNKKLS